MMQGNFILYNRTLFIFSQVNGIGVLDLGHNEVVTLIQSLPIHFRLVVARRKDNAEEEEAHEMTATNHLESENSILAQEGNFTLTVICY